MDDHIVSQRLPAAAAIAAEPPPPPSPPPPQVAAGALGAGAGVASAANLGERIQRDKLRSVIKAALRAAVTDNEALIPDILRLALNDIATYDKATATGGPNGSIRLSEELGRPENAGLDKALGVLGSVKAKLDDSQAALGGPIGWADLIQYAAEVAVQGLFLNAATRKVGGDPEKGRQLYNAFGSSGQWGAFEKLLGRKDAAAADPAGRVIDWEPASVADLKAKFASLGLTGRQLVVFSVFLGPDLEKTEAKLATDPELAGYVTKYQRSRKTISETDYEVDLINALTKICALNQKINFEAYTYATPTLVFNKL
eukprot:SM000020S05997  [mRNA]  locus=s20:354406:356786:+ [translate_table: standard]